MPGCALGLGVTVISAACVVGSAAPALAQPLSTGQPVLPVAPGDVNGRDFAGLKLGVKPQIGPISFSAQQAIAWNEEPAAGPRAGTTVGETVQRLLLRGDVRVTVGLYTFAAAQAVVWVEPMGPSPADPNRTVHQVAVFFDRVSDPGSEHGTTQSGDRLLVTGLLEGEVSLRADSLSEGRPADNLVLEGEQRLARFLLELATPAGQSPPEMPAPPGDLVTGFDPLSRLLPGRSQPFEPDSPYARPPSRAILALPDDRPALTEERPQPLFSGEGLVTFAGGEPTFIGGANGEESTILITGGVTVQYTDARRGRNLQITAERAVVFLAPGPVQDLMRAPADKILGIYLEGQVVATDGKFTLRGPQVFYDVPANRAYVADAVFWTYDQRRGMPLYVRAKALRQTATNQVEAQDATLANSSFFTPHLSMGARTVTVTRDQRPGEAPRTLVQGQDLTLRAGKLPFFYWPGFSGDAERFPLREIGFESSSNSGAGVKTAWDIFGILGYDAPSGVQANLLLDGFLKRGVAVGTDSKWETPQHTGSLLGYIVPDDRGRDTLTSGEKVERRGETRGLIALEHTWKLNANWSIQLEASSISDPNFVDAYYEPLAETRREFASSAFLKYQESNSQFAVLAKGSFNNFTVNEYLLQSQGYTVDKLPEATYFRAADDLLGFAWPGLLQWSQEWRVGRMAFSLTEKAPRDLGFSSPFLADRAFGILPGTGIDQALLARGLRENDTNRVDTRQELTAQLRLGPVNITPFAVGRFTGYDDRFNAFRAGSNSTNDERNRFWYSGGVRASTSLVKIDDQVESDLFDIHRVRHIIEPSLTVFTAGTNIRREELPIYDETVEGLSEGTALRAGLSQTWQTQRGGPGRWRSVDVLRLDAEYVNASADAERKSPIARFFDFRPEYSVLGDSATLDGLWQATDATGFTLNTIYDLEINQPARTTAGVQFDHSDDFRTFIEVHYLNARDSTFVTFGADYRLTELYTVSAAATYDVDSKNFQSVGGRINREFPGLIVSLKLAYNDITNEFSAGVAVTPAGRDKRRDAIRRLGRDQIGLGEPAPDAGKESPGSLWR